MCMSSRFESLHDPCSQRKTNLNLSGQDLEDSEQVSSPMFQEVAQTPKQCCSHRHNAAKFDANAKLNNNHVIYYIPGSTHVLMVKSSLNQFSHLWKGIIIGIDTTSILNK